MFLRSKFSAPSLLATLLLMAVPASADNGQSLYQSAIAKYDSLSSFQATIKSTVSLEPIDGGQPNTVQSTTSVRFRRPNFLHVDQQGLMGGGEAVSDGKMLYTYSALTNQYGSRPAPKDLLSMALGGMKSAANLKTVGKTTIDGVSVLHLTGSVDSYGGVNKADVYIDNVTKLVRRTVVHIPHLPGAQGGNFRMTMTSDYVSQSLNPSFASNLFKFTPPSGAEKAASGSLPAISTLPGS